MTGALLFDDAMHQSAYTIVFTTAEAGQVAFDVVLGTASFPSPVVNQVRLTYSAPPAERFFGFGIQYSFVDLRGQVIPIWVSEQGVGRGLQPLTFLLNTFDNYTGETSVASYATVPLYVTSLSRALCLHSMEYAAFDLTLAERVSVAQLTTRMHGRIFSGTSLLDLLTVVTSHTGRMAALPSWISQGAVLGTQGGDNFVPQKLTDLLTAHPDCPIAALWLQDWAGTQPVPWGVGMQWNWEGTSVISLVFVCLLVSFACLLLLSTFFPKTLLP
jgi:alpha-glucosidase